MHLDPCFVDHLVFFITQGPLGPLVVRFCLDPTLPCFTTCCIFLIYFFFGQFWPGFGPLPLILELITQLLIIVNHLVSLKRGACIAHGEVSFLPATSITVSLYLHHLLENSLGSSTIYSVFYAINWVHKLAGFENHNQSV